jgi:hypothetical protein
MAARLIPVPEDAAVAVTLSSERERGRRPCASRRGRQQGRRGAGGGPRRPAGTAGCCRHSSISLLLNIPLSAQWSVGAICASAAAALLLAIMSMSICQFASVTYSCDICLWCVLIMNNNEQYQQHELQHGTRHLLGAPPCSGPSQVPPSRRGLGRGGQISRVCGIMWCV